MVTDCEIRYLAYNTKLENIDYKIFPSCKVTCRRIKNEERNRFAITWCFNFTNSRKIEVYSDISEARFYYFSVGDIEQDFYDLKRFLFQCFWEFTQNILEKDNRLVFPEENLDRLTCKLLERIIMEE